MANFFLGVICPILIGAVIVVIFIAMFDYLATALRMFMRGEKGFFSFSFRYLMFNLVLGFILLMLHYAIIWVQSSKTDTEPAKINSIQTSDNASRPNE